MKTAIVPGACEGDPQAASRWHSYLAQLRVELLLLLRQPENVLVILILPVLLLVFFAGVKVLPSVRGRPIDFLVPGILTLALMSTGLVTLGISTAYQRYYRVLKRLGGTPLRRGALVAAKATSVLLIEVGQVVLLLLIASLGFGWRGHGSPLLVVLVLMLGAFTFAAIGLTMAGALRAELTLGGANGLYLLFLVLGGIAVPIRQLPFFIQPIASALPPSAVSASLRALLEGRPFPTTSLALLAGWALVSGAAAVFWFRWE
ncbi:MAG: ABC transporter permease [Candidatus Dormibacteria bacterium]